MPVYNITVNGTRHRVDTDSDTPLLWVLRASLGLTGTKYGCGAGICGACTVLEGDTALRSCQLPIESANGRKFTTIEGLTHPSQRAWLEEDVAQCGFCQPGMIVQAVALLRSTPRPSDGQIAAAMNDHICRCGTYPRIRRAIHRAAGEPK